MISAIIIGLTRFLVGGTGLWLGCAPSARQRIYFANHSSHLDTIILWAAMPPDLRRRVRPVAAAAGGDPDRWLVISLILICVGTLLTIVRRTLRIAQRLRSAA